MIQDANAIIKEYLDSCTDLTDLVSTRIYCPRLPENCTLPAVGFFCRGGMVNPHIPPIVTPSVQFDCWADDPIEARKIYRALYDNLQGIENETVTIDGTDYSILSAIEEVHGQDLSDSIQGYFRVLTFFSVMIRVDS